MSEEEMVLAYDRMDTDIERGNKIRIMAELIDSDADYVVAVLKDAGRRIPGFIPKKSTGVMRENASHQKQRKQSTKRPGPYHRDCRYFVQTKTGKNGGIRGICLHPSVRARYGDIERSGSGPMCKAFEEKKDAIFEN